MARKNRKTEHKNILKRYDAAQAARERVTVQQIGHTHMPVNEARKLLDDLARVVSDQKAHVNAMLADWETLAALWADGDPDAETVKAAVYAVLVDMELLSA